MDINATVLKIKRLRNDVDWKLLLFLVLFLDVKLVVKIAAIALIYLLQFNFQFGFKIRQSRLPLFYPMIIAIAVIAAFSTRTYPEHNYLIVLATGICFWVLCILAVHQVKLSVERNDPVIIHRTIAVFFMLNAFISLLKLGTIVLETHAVNPYTYQGQYQKYFMNTGDYIKGLSFDTSTTNAIFNAFGVIYFLVKQNVAMLLLCMVVLLLTASNFVNLALISVLAGLFILGSRKEQKSLIVVCLMFLVVFISKVSPQNKGFVLQNFRNVFHLKNPGRVQSASLTRITERPDSVLNPEEKREKIATLYIDSVYRANEKFYRRQNIFQQNKSVVLTDEGRVIIPKPDIHSAAYQNLSGTPPEQRQLPVFIKEHQQELPISGKPYHRSRIPGKVTALVQTANFFVNHPLQLIAGLGPGNFSSKLAFRASGLGFAGGFPSAYAYINRDFLINHLDLYLNFFSRRAELHSLTNSPFSVYDQLLAEYGILGLLAFIIFYAGFFVKHLRKLTYGLPVIALTFMVLFMDYWFEQLSVIVFFELLLFLDIKESSAAII
jgi:hypothetical protein